LVFLWAQYPEPQRADQCAVEPGSPAARAIDYWFGTKTARSGLSGIDPSRDWIERRTEW